MTQQLSNAPTRTIPRRSLGRIPRATYRLQLRVEFGFEEVAKLTDYLEQFGVSDLYLSPLFRARKDSSHGYDVVDHAVMEAEFGEPGTFAAMAQEVRGRGMGILLDVVPNHMGVNDPGNRWWYDVLENGETSQYARFFDIDWHRLPAYLRHRVLLPVLSDHFGHVLERGELRLLYYAGRFRISYFGSQFPLSPHSWSAILRRALDHLSAAAASKPEDISSSPEQVELESIVTQLVHLPPRDDYSDAASRERYREQNVAAVRLAQLLERSNSVRQALEKAIEGFNGVAGEPSTFNSLESLLSEQHYRLAYWRVAADEINYRRFFDINDLAAIRVEDPTVFAAVHDLVKRLLEDDQITGLRIDHPDGLLDPLKYFDELQKLFLRSHGGSNGEATPGQLYVVVEKILTGEEPLRDDWPVCGTTGYDLLNDLNRLFVDEAGLEMLRREYASLTDIEASPSEIIYLSKKRVLDDAMSSELNMLAGDLHRLTQRHRVSRDFTFSALLRALRELIACFPVYRTYIPPRGWEVDDADYGHVMAAVRQAKRRNPTMARSILDFLSSVLLLRYPLDVEEPDREEFRQFVLKFQQVTGPVTAKGIEDTSFYRYYPLVSLNEVGGEIDSEPLSVDEFHRRMHHRASDWPHGLSATATHDTKRGEDVRARLHVLSEVAEEWLQTVRQWQELNHPFLRTVGGAYVPGRNEEYLLYQTLVGTWPLEVMDVSERNRYVDRITGYMEKALREAKINTSWANPVDEYEQAAVGFVRDLLDAQRSAPFLQQLQKFVEDIADAGFVNSLAQVVLKVVVPGVPDFYQGTELWDFNLVDPDNRRPVDYSQRTRWLADLRRGFADDPHSARQELLAKWPDPRIKLWVAWRALQARADVEGAFTYGSYVPLTVTGRRAAHVVALARCHRDQWIVAVTALHVQHLVERWRGIGDPGPPLIDWGGTTIQLPTDAPHCWSDAFSTMPIESATNADGTAALLVEHVLSRLPVAILTTRT